MLFWLREQWWTIKWDSRKPETYHPFLSCSFYFTTLCDMEHTHTHTHTHTSDLCPFPPTCSSMMHAVPKGRIECDGDKENLPNEADYEELPDEEEDEEDDDEEEEEDDEDDDNTLFSSRCFFPSLCSVYLGGIKSNIPQSQTCSMSFISHHSRSPLWTLNNSCCNHNWLPSVNLYHLTVVCRFVFKCSRERKIHKGQIHAIHTGTHAGNMFP